MKTEAEVRRAIERLSTHGFEARSEPHSEGALNGTVEGNRNGRR